MSDPAPGAQTRSASAPTGKSGSAQARMEIKGQIREKVRSAVTERSGPSFDERLEAAVTKKTLQMKTTEKEQWKRINECRDKGHMKSEMMSPIAAMKKRILQGEKGSEALIAQKLAEREEAMKQQTKNFYRDRKAMLEKIRNREPLFRLTEVAAAQGALQAAAEKRKNDMKEDERKRWEHIEELNRNVLNRPLLMD